jgi:hypothetical protein
LLYTNDLNLTEGSEEELRNEIRILKRISNDIETEYELEKCGSVSSKTG